MEVDICEDCGGVVMDNSDPFTVNMLEDVYECECPSNIQPVDNHPSQENQDGNDTVNGDPLQGSSGEKTTGGAT